MKSLGYARDYGETSPEIARLFDLGGRVAIVTGGASGLGRAIGLGLARFGADVVVADRDRAGAEAVVEAIRALGRRAEALAVDVTNWESVAAMAARARELFGNLDILVNSAGGNVRKPTLEMSPAEWQQVLTLNLTG